MNIKIKSGRDQVKARLLVSCLALSAGLAFPAAAFGDAGATSASFLKIPVGARAIGMGSAFTALSDDVFGMYWNTAGLSQLKARNAEVGLTHAQLFGDVQYDVIGAALPATYGVWGLGVNRLSQGTIEGRSDTQEKTGNFGAADTSFNMAFAAKLTESLGVGVGAKFLQSKLADVQAATYAFDLGGIYRLSRWPLRLGVSVQNVGPGMRFIEDRAPLPLKLAAGASYRLGSGLSLAADVARLPYDHANVFSVGTEYAVFPSVAIRSGYLGQSAAGAATGATFAGRLNGLSFGLGITLWKYSLDYALTPMGELGNAQRISLIGRF